MTCWWVNNRYGWDRHLPANLYRTKAISHIESPRSKLTVSCRWGTCPLRIAKHTSKRNIPSTNGSNNSDVPLYSLSAIIVIRQLAGVNIESTPIRPSGFLRVFSSGTIAGGHFRVRTAPKLSGALQTRQESPQNPYVSHLPWRLHHVNSSSISSRRSVLEVPGFVQGLRLRNLGAKAVPGMLEIETIQTFGTTSERNKENWWDNYEV